MFNLEALFDIALKNIPDKFIDIIALVPDPTELWKTTLTHIVVENGPAPGNRHCRHRHGVDSFCLAIFRKRKRIEIYRMMASGQVSCQLSAEQFGIRSRNDYMNLSAQQTVYKQIPFRNILYFVNEKIIEVSIYFYRTSSTSLRSVAVRFMRRSSSKLT